jgi:hypothetical protein
MKKAATNHHQVPGSSGSQRRNSALWFSPGGIVTSKIFPLSLFEVVIMGELNVKDTR